MKKIMLVVIAIFMMVNVYAQLSNDSIKVNFVMKGATGTFSTNSNNDFYIIDYCDKKATELYTNVLSAIATIYKNPEKVLSKVENISINISATAVDVPVPRDADKISSFFPNKNDYYAFDYTLQFQFKDGKIKVNAPTFAADNIYYASPLDNGRYKQVDNPRFGNNHFTDPSDKIRLYFEKYINDMICNILKKSEIVNNW